LYNIILDDNAGDVVNEATDITGNEWWVLANAKKYYWVRRKGITFEQGYYWENWKNWIKSSKTTQRLWLKAARNGAFVVLSNGTDPEPPELGD
jgi:hypothetical protein